MRELFEHAGKKHTQYLSLALGSGGCRRALQLVVVTPAGPGVETQGTQQGPKTAQLLLN